MTKTQKTVQKRSEGRRVMVKARDEQTSKKNKNTTEE